MKIKAILTILISLVIGFVFGFLASGQLMKHEMQKKHSHTYQEVFIFRTLDIIKPSESQKDTIMPIIKSYAEKTLILKNKVSGELDSTMRQMGRDLRPYVSEEQYKRMEESAERFKSRFGR